MKEYFVNLGGQDRRLRYTPKDGVDLYRKFGKPLRALFEFDVLGGFASDGAGLANYNPDAQVAVLLAGLSHDEKRLTEEKLCGWIEEHYASGGTMWDLAHVASKAAYFSGIVLGRSVNIEDDIKTAGKGQPETTPPTTPATVPASE